MPPRPCATALAACASRCPAHQFTDHGPTGICFTSVCVCSIPAPSQDRLSQCGERPAAQVPSLDLALCPASPAASYWLPHLLSCPPPDHGNCARHGVNTRLSSYVAVFPAAAHIPSNRTVLPGCPPHTARSLCTLRALRPAPTDALSQRPPLRAAARSCPYPNSASRDRQPKKSRPHTFLYRVYVEYSE